MAMHGTRTFALLRAEGWHVEKVEQFIPGGRMESTPEGDMHTGHGTRRDFLGFIDALALRDGAMLGVQMCSQSGYKEHERKVLASPLLRTWLMAAPGHHHVEIWSWRRRKLSRGSKAIRWWGARYRLKASLDGGVYDTEILTRHGAKAAEFAFYKIDDIGPDHDLVRTARSKHKIARKID
jgi:hypothetical protein